MNMLSAFYVLSMLMSEFSCVNCLYTYISNNTHWQSISDFTPLRNTSYGNITLHRALEMQFNFIYYGKTSENTYENVFRIGYSGANKCNGAGTRYPAMWIHPETPDTFQITISPHYGACWDNNSPRIPIQEHHQYHIIIKFNQTWQHASIDNGTETHVFINNARLSPTADTVLDTIMNVWMSTKHVPSANVTLSDIMIKTWNPITPQPTNTPTLIPTTFPTDNPTISTMIPTIYPTINPTQTPSLKPTNNPTIAPTHNPTMPPTKTPTDNPTTSTPTISPSINPTSEPSIEPTYFPTQREINAREPTYNPLHEAHIPETTFSTSYAISNTTKSPWDGKWLIIPVIIAFICLLCCFLIFFWKRCNDLKMHKSVSSSKTKSAIFNDANNKEDIIFDKIYEKQMQLNIKEENDIGKRDDVLLPNEDSVDTLSSDVAEQMYVPQTQTRTITAPQTITDFNMSIRDSNNISLNSKMKKRRSYSHQSLQSYTRELELQQQVTLVISDKNGIKRNDYTMNDGEGYDLYKDIKEESEEDVDLHIYNGKYKHNYKKKNKHLILSNSATPEMELYGKGQIGSNNDYLQAPTIKRGNDSKILALYDKPSFTDHENTAEGTDDYQWIRQTLQICDPIDWQKYLNNFKKNKVNDFRLNQLNENDLKQLIDSIGPRNDFKQLCDDYKRQSVKSMHL